MPSFNRGSGDWEGVLMIERLDPTKISEGDDPMCRVMSARTIQLGGRRAINTRLPYSMVSHLFRAGDLDTCFVEAEFKADGQGGGHLQFYERSRASLKDWVLYSMNPDQIAAAAASH
jgi:hypothetical protein